MLQEEYLDEGKAKAGRAAVKGGKKLLDKLKGKGGKAGKNAGKGSVGGAAKTAGAAAVGSGVVSGVGSLVGAGVDAAKDVAGALAKKAKKIWDGGETDVDSDGAPGDHQGLPKSS